MPVLLFTVWQQQRVRWLLLDWLYAAGRTAGSATTRGRLASAGALALVSNAAAALLAALHFFAHVLEATLAPAPPPAPWMVHSESPASSSLFFFFP